MHRTTSEEEDFGVSVQAFASIGRRWSDRLVLANGMLLAVAVCLWQRAETEYTQALFATAGTNVCKV